jgi:hypothetical protein
VRVAGVGDDVDDDVPLRVGHRLPPDAQRLDDAGHVGRLEQEGGGRVAAVREERTFDPGDDPAWS